MIVGSLIKNPGGGIAKTGGYIAGRKDLVELCSYRLTCVGMGKEVGCTLSESRSMFLGLYFAPSVVASAVKTSVFALSLFDLLALPFIRHTTHTARTSLRQLRLQTATA